MHVSMQSRLIRILTVTFFLGLPFVGLMLFWKDAHRKIEEAAAPVARQMTEDVLSKWDKKLLDDLGTMQFRSTNAVSEFEKSGAKLGKYQGMEGWKQVRSVAGSRDDMVWQFVYYTGTGKFEKGQATVNVTIGRRTMSPEWRIEAFELKPR